MSIKDITQLSSIQNFTLDWIGLLVHQFLFINDIGAAFPYFYKVSFLVIIKSVS